MLSLWDKMFLTFKSHSLQKISIFGATIFDTKDSINGFAMLSIISQLVLICNFYIITSSFFWNLYTQLTHY